jgi:hypothetical protein
MLVLTKPLCAYQPEHVQQEVSVLPDNVEGLAAQVNKVVEFCSRFVTSVYYKRHVRGKHERSAVPVLKDE